MKDLEPIIDPRLYQNRKDFPAEVVYEITTKKNGLPFGIAVADIQQSQPHFHKHTIETYTVVQGDIEVTLGTEQRILHVGDAIQILPGVIHSARSLGETPARITVTTIPEFSPDDYLPVSDEGSLASSPDQQPDHISEARQLPEEPDHIAPDGSEIRELGTVACGGLAHCTLPRGGVSKAVSHRTVDEIWFCISGTGRIWRKFEDRESDTNFIPGTSVTILRGATFQFRNTGTDALCFVIATIPTWPGPDEAVPAESHWGPGAE